MFAPSSRPRVFTLPPGVDFPRALAQGLRARAAGPPEALARAQVFLNTRRMLRRLRGILAAEGALLLPRLRLVTDLDDEAAMADLPPPVPALRRRLELSRLVAALIAAEPGIAPESAVYDLADSLAALFEEMQGEDVPLSRLEALDIADHARHWERSLAFLRIAARFADPEPGEAPDAELRRRRVVERLETLWRADPPAHPVIVAGSTGSRGTTARLMRLVATLPQGAVILPGFDDTLPPAVWEALDDGLTAEDHPQARFRRFLASLDMEPGEARPWLAAEPPSRARNALVSLALRPAPVTDQWLAEGPALGDPGPAADGMTLVEAPSPRAEALAIALRLRRAADEGVTAALITPDRGLTRQVAAALDRWGIIPDDSAGQPLGLSAPGRLLRQVADLGTGRLTAEALLAILKHPLAHAGAERGWHLKHTRDLELALRRRGPVFPTPPDILAWDARAKHDDPGRRIWAEWLAGWLGDAQPSGGDRPLAEHVARHLALAARIVAGSAEGTAGDTPLWSGAAGEAAHAAMDAFAREAPHGGAMEARAYARMLAAILQRAEVREAVTPHPRIMIWGTLEARVQGADLVILGGLNDGIWPQIPPPDPWLSRRMRLEAGLLLPERRIGLSAHDFQQAVAAPEVWLTRAIRSDEAETVPSRWLNRLTNLMAGLETQGGRAALSAMRARGARWLALAQALDRPEGPPRPEPRPSPSPPVAHRPRELAVTGVRTLIRDPYAIYARHILRLRPLDPLHPEPDAALRGSVLHAILETWMREGARPERLLPVADAILARDVPWPVARTIWRARLARVVDWFLAREAARQGRPALLEDAGGALVGPSGFRLTARPDRIDLLEDGRAEIIDYKTGKPPTPKQQAAFDKQLLLEAAMAERGAFGALGPVEVAAAVYIGLGATPAESPVDLSPGATTQAWEQLGRLVAGYATRARGYTSRRAMEGTRFEGDYDHLARFGEWETSDPPVHAEVGGPDEGGAP